METYRRGELKYEGKTKIVYRVEGRSDLVILANKDNITAFDDPSFTKQFDTKAVSATTTTCRVFELLEKAGVPVAYEGQLSATEFVTPWVAMIPLEVVIRGYAMGSYLKRNPSLARPEGDSFRFPVPLVEFFLKTTAGRVMLAGGDELDLGLDPKKGEEDPLILDPLLPNWTLCHPKKPLDQSGAVLGHFENAYLGVGVNNSIIAEIQKIARQTFIILRDAWKRLGLNLIDMKIEFGVRSDGQIVVADVIDNDSWRLRDREWQEISKQAFRDGEALDQVEAKYACVAELAGQLTY